METAFDIDTRGEELRVLAVGAHPDDVDYGAAGTMAKWASLGSTITYLVVTSGDEGAFAELAAQDIPQTRRREQIAAADAVGVRDVRFLDGYRDGSVAVAPELVRDIARVIRQVRPHVVVTLSPERLWSSVFQGHPDHLAVGEATTRAVYPTSRNPHAFPELIVEEGLQEWIVSELWLMNHPQADLAVDIEPFLEQKIAAIAAHASQHHSPDTLRESLLERMRRASSARGMPDGRIVEVFLRVDTNEDRALRVVDPASLQTRR